MPDFMNPQSPNYDPNWSNNPTPLAEPVWVRFGNGTVHKTVYCIHIARWIAEDGAVVIDKPEGAA